MADLKRVYAAPIEETALAKLDSFDEKWSRKYPKITKTYGSHGLLIPQHRLVSSPFLLWLF